MTRAWYTQYSDLVTSVKERRSEYFARCKILGVDSNVVLDDVWSELVARAVKESNWQEGLKLSEPRTQQLATEAIQIHSQKPRLRVDTNSILRRHRRIVAKFKKQGMSREEIGAFNLSAAYNVIPFIILELMSRREACLAKAIENFKPLMAKHGDDMPADLKKHLVHAFDLVDKSKTSRHRSSLPLTEPISTEGEHMTRLLQEDFEALLRPMTAMYFHFLHRLTLAGLYPTRACGRYRKTPVHVGRPDVMFPAPTLVPGLMKEYCHQFPSLVTDASKFDPIMAAARTSYRFVAIHPYADGNGRVSRLLMNLVLYAYQHPPVYLKADKKGRHRYGSALRWANRGHFEPLGCLIAASLEQVYKRLLRTVNL